MDCGHVLSWLDTMTRSEVIPVQKRIRLAEIDVLTARFGWLARRPAGLCVDVLGTVCGVVGVLGVSTVILAGVALPGGICWRLKGHGAFTGSLHWLQSSPRAVACPAKDELSCGCDGYLDGV
jgi:hypothetical protein